MIEVNGHYAFKGVMKVWNTFGEESLIKGEWLFSPNAGKWFCKEEDGSIERYLDSKCEVVEDYTESK